MTHNFVLKEFREQLNISQIEMAKFLRTSRSQVAMVERGEHTLTTDAATRLLTLYNCSTETPTLSSETTIQVAEGTDQIRKDIQDKWRDRLTKSRYEKHRLGYHLINMVKEWESTLLLAQSMEQMMQVTSTLQGVDHYRLFAHTQMYRAHNKLVSSGEAAQQALRVRIEVLDAEIPILEKNLSSGK